MNIRKLFDGFSLKDWTFIFLVIVTWGANAAVSKIGTNEISPQLLIFLRAFFTALLFAPFARKVSLSDFKNLTLIGFVFIAAHFSCMYAALGYINSNSYVVIILLGMPISILLSALFLKEKFGLWTCIGMAVSFSGLIAAFGLPDIQQYPIGATLALCAAFLWAAGSLLMKRTKHIPLGSFVFYTYAISVPILAIIGFAVDGSHMFDFTGVNWLNLGGSLFYQVVIIGAMTAVWAYLIGNHRAEYVSPFLMLQIPVAALAGYVLLQESITPNFVISSILIIGGVGLIHYRRLKKISK